jgi:putative addiction module antidote
MTTKVRLNYPTTLQIVVPPQISRIRLLADTRYYDCGNMLHNCSADELRTAQIGTRCSMVALKVRKVGNSLGLVLPKEVVNRLHTKEGEEVFLIEGPNNTYRLTPFDPAFQKKMKKAEEIMSRYRNTLNVLSK